MRKLENAVGNVQSALLRLTNAEIPPNASSTPEQVLTAHQALLDALKDVEIAARNRNHQQLMSSIKRLVAAAAEQAEHSKGVAQLTDDPELSAELSNAAEAATKVLQLLLATIKENPYDADPIIAQCVAVRDASMILEHATQKIIDAERVSDSDDDLTDKATSELMNAAKVIEDAAKILAEAKRRAEEKAREKYIIFYFFFILIFKRRILIFLFYKIIAKKISMFLVQLLMVQWLLLMLFKLLFKKLQLFKKKM